MPWRQRLWPPLDPALAAASARGEIAVARGRVVLTLLILAVPLAALWGGFSLEAAMGVGVATLAVLFALVVLRVVSRDHHVPGLGFVTSLVDVTLVSLLQVAYLIAGMPSIAANSRTTFSVYLVAVAATAMRWDFRVCIAAGLAAIAQYGAIAWVAWLMWVPQPTAETAIYGRIVPGQQVARLIILLAATWVAVAVARQGTTLLAGGVSSPGERAGSQQTAAREEEP
jgi:hypothetical protein